MHKNERELINSPQKKKKKERNDLSYVLKVFVFKRGVKKVRSRLLY